jgi:murein DD-endopeptidase MepM/ murein hydrolase activator NlpD
MMHCKRAARLIMSPWQLSHRCCARRLVVWPTVTVGLMNLLVTVALAAPQQPLFRTVDLNRGELQEVELSNGNKVKVKLLEVEEARDSLRSAIRLATIKIEINGTPGVLISGNYRLPVTVGGVQVDCPVTKGYYQNHDPWEDSWGLVKDVRLRLWPQDSTWLAAGTFVYPARQRWFASATQIGNEPSYVDGGDHPSDSRRIYYHSGNDIGGCEGMIEVVSACDGLVVSAGGKALAEYTDVPFYKPSGDYDYVYVIDAHGWFYRYAHLKSIDPAIQPGTRVKMGQKIGVLGKEGSSGGWAHLHFDIKAKQPSGKWGIQDAYPFLWESYLSEHKPGIIAIARPHHLIAAGEKVTLDGSRSWSAAGKITRYQWTFGDGSTAAGATVERTYEKPGSYSEILMVSDSQGRTDFDFAIVQVLDKGKTENLPPTIHASYAPTFDIRAGDPVTFKVRTFRTDRGNETWDFGDGSEAVTVHSAGSAKEHDPAGYAETVHHFMRPGHYIVRVEGTGYGGLKATGHLQVRVAEK